MRKYFLLLCLFLMCGCASNKIQVERVEDGYHLEQIASDLPMLYGGGYRYVKTEDGFEVESIRGDGQFIKEMIRRNDYNGCSFAFTDDMVDVEYDRERGLFIRNVRKIKQLYDCSIVADPAYSDTEVSLRSLEEVLEKEVATENKDDSWKEELDKYRQRLN